LQPGTRHIDLDLSEGTHQRARTPPMPVAGGACVTVGVFATLRPPPVAGTRQCRVKLLVDQFFDEPADAPADLGLKRVNPVVEKMARDLILRLRGIGRRASPCHGVVSCPALQRRMIRG